MKSLRRAAVALIACSGLFVGLNTFAPPNALAQSITSYTCNNGTVAPGLYGTLTIVGHCTIRTGLVDVLGNLVVTPNAGLTASVPGTAVFVGQNIYVMPSAALDLGCSQGNGCSVSSNDVVVKGNIVATSTLGVIVHGAVIEGSITITNGGGGVVCGFDPLFGAPVFSDIEDSVVLGNITISGLRTCYFGLFRDTVIGNVNVNYNTSADPDSTEMSNNVIIGNLSCTNNVPAPQIGLDNHSGSPSVVVGSKLGQCASGV